MNDIEYWKEAVGCSLDEAGFRCDDKLIDTLAADMSIAHENYGLAYPTPSGPHPLVSELKQCQEKLAEERTKEVCKECGGSGIEVIHGPIHSSRSDCWKCNGEGWLLPGQQYS